MAAGFRYKTKSDMVICLHDHNLGYCYRNVLPLHLCVQKKCSAAKLKGTNQQQSHGGLSLPSCPCLHA